MVLRPSLAALVVALAAYVFLGWIGLTDCGNPRAADANYNLLARGLLKGQLSIDKQAAAGLAALPDPYDPDANRPFRRFEGARLQDITYYRGRLFLYFGAAPALLLFIPWHLLTTTWLAHWAAVALLCAAGLLISARLVRAIGSEAFPDAPEWAMAAAVLVLGFASYAPLLLARADMWEVPIAFCYACVSAALWCLWKAMGAAAASPRWIALASLAFGAAFAARPTVLPGAAILLAPFLAGGARRNPRAWAAAIGPLVLCGLAVAAYNARRFGSPFEFGQHFQLSDDYESKMRHFGADYLTTNLGLYLFKGVQWSGVFPFAHEPAVSALPAGHGRIEHISGILLNAPILWAALALPFLAAPTRRVRAILLSAAWLGLSSLILMGCFFGTCSRYQFEFTPALALLAAVGVVGMESRLRGAARLAARVAAAAAVLFSCAFTFLYAIDRAVVDHTNYGRACLIAGRYPQARTELAIAESLSPGYGTARLASGLLDYAEHRLEEARVVIAGVARDYPGYATVHYDLAMVLAAQGRFPEAAAQYRATLALEPANQAAAAGLRNSLAHGK